jgi:hypothetical protein
MIGKEGANAIGTNRKPGPVRSSTQSRRWIVLQVKLSPPIVEEIIELTARARQRDRRVGVSTVLRELIHIGLGHAERPEEIS